MNLFRPIAAAVLMLSQLGAAEAQEWPTRHITAIVAFGAGNSVDPGAFDHATGALVIQNTLDNQQIQALTTLTASVRDLGQFNGINLGNSLQSALINSRGQ